MNVYVVTDGYFRAIVRADYAWQAIDYAAAHDLAGLDSSTLRAFRK